jgi:hypothetical protein
MLTCVPMSICSWNYRVLGLPAGEGRTWINRMSEQGSVSLGGVLYDVVKHGWMSGMWTLEERGHVFATAQKLSAFTRTMVVSCGEASLTVEAMSPFSRAFELRDRRDVVGVIRPVHLFTRRGEMSCDAAVPQVAQMFVFWLVAMSWRRTANKNNG